MPLFAYVGLVMCLIGGSISTYKAIQVKKAGRAWFWIITMAVPTILWGLVFGGVINAPGP